MMQSVTVSPRPGTVCTVNYSGEPEKCPVCRRSINPSMLTHTFYGSEEEGRLQIVYQCPATLCRRLYLVTYTPGETHEANSAYTPDLVETVTITHESFSEWVSAISPAFIEIYNQALAAETHGLNHACGPAYRKALEFLIKDFLLKTDRCTEEQLKTTKEFGTLIENFVEHEDLKAMAKRAAWLGNDETHYLRKWGDKDLSDLKNLITVTVSWVELVLKTNRYKDEMPHGRR